MRSTTSPVCCSLVLVPSPLTTHDASYRVWLRLWAGAGPSSPPRGQEGFRPEFTPLSHSQLAKWTEQLAPQGKSLILTKPDGNCIFRAFSTAHNGSEDLHPEYREEAIGYMMLHSDEFINFLAPSSRPNFKSVSGL